MIFNLHTHTKFSDGSEDPEKYVEEAIRQGFSVLGFSDHSPVQFENTFAIPEGKLEDYCKAIKALASKSNFPPLSSRGGTGGGVAEGMVGVLLGLEIDCIPGITKPINWYRENYSFDYFIGSVHFVRNENSDALWFIDGPDMEIYDRGLKEIFRGDIQKAITAYYHQMNEMIVNEKPDIIGHMDKIKMYNRGRYFSESDDWYLALIDETLDLASGLGCVIEVNTRGIYKKRSETLFPGPDVLKKIKALRIPITLSSDAHKPAEISLYFKDAKLILSDLGFKTLTMKDKAGWQEVAIQ